MSPRTNAQILADYARQVVEAARKGAARIEEPNEQHPVVQAIRRNFPVATGKDGES